MCVYLCVSGFIDKRMYDMFDQAIEFMCTARIRYHTVRPSNVFCPNQRKCFQNAGCTCLYSTRKFLRNFVWIFPGVKWIHPSPESFGFSMVFLTLYIDSQSYEGDTLLGHHSTSSSFTPNERGVGAQYDGGNRVLKRCNRGGPRGGLRRY